MYVSVYYMEFFFRSTDDETDVRSEDTKFLGIIEIEVFVSMFFL